MWTVRKHRGQWWNLDSQLSPRTVPHLGQFSRNNTYGFLLIFGLDGIKEQLQPLLQNRVCTHLRHHNLKSPHALLQWLLAPRGGEGMGELEPALMSLLRLFCDHDPGLRVPYRFVLANYTKVVLDPQLSQHYIYPLLRSVILPSIN